MRMVQVLTDVENDLFAKQSHFVRKHPALLGHTSSTSFLALGVTVADGVVQTFGDQI